MRRPRWQASRSRRSALVLSAAVAGCGGSTTLDDYVPDGGTGCPAGSEGCACYDNGTCDVGLDCVSQRCLVPIPASTGGRSAGTPPTAGRWIGTGGTPNYPTGGAAMIWTGGAGMIWIGGMPGTGATGAQPSGFQILAAGFVVSGPWHGYAWTAAVTSAAAVAGGTTTITPPDFSAVPAGATELCVGGSVGPATDYGAPETRWSRRSRSGAAVSSSGTPTPGPA